MTEIERFFGRRKGKKLKPHRAELIETLLPTLKPDLAELPKWREVWLEVGFGGGEHLAVQAENHPDILMIGCEPFINGTGKLLGQIEEKKLNNIRILGDDARPLLDALPTGSISRAFVLFADPWPKNRHADRRFIGTPNLDRLARVIRPGCQLRLASDHPVLQSWTLMQMAKRNDFKWMAEKAADFMQRPADWPPTRYEMKALHGIPIFLTYTRV